MLEDAQGELEVQGPDSFAVSNHELTGPERREQRVEKNRKR